MQNLNFEYNCNIKKTLNETHYGNVLDLVYAAAEKFPLKVALADKENSVTYGELISKIEQTSELLHEYGVDSGDIIALHGKKSITLFITMLAVFRIAAIVMPMSEDLPLQRKQKMIKQVNSKWAIHFDHNHREIFSGCKNIVFEESLAASAHRNAEFSEKVISFNPVKQILPKIDGNAPAYIFFTSGSTSEPKAIIGMHKSVTQFVAWEKSELKLTDSLIVLQLASISFDAVLRDLFLPLISGGKLFIPETETAQDPLLLMNVIESEKINLIHTIPSVMANWLKIKTKICFKNLEYFILSGEPLFRSLIEKWRQKFPECHAKFVNFYGPTETTMIKTFFKVQTEMSAELIPCGRPIRDTEIYIFDNNDKILNANQKGEIIIRTHFRTLGYLENNRLDVQDKFFVNPYRCDNNDILYRTGDLGYLTEEGILHVEGRKDDEIKINGIRINPLEVAAVLSSNSKVSSCSVLSNKIAGGNNILIAVMVLKEGEEASPEYFRKFLQDKLPLAMIPSTFEFLASLPLLNNGKIDKNAILKIMADNKRNINIENKAEISGGRESTGEIASSSGTISEIELAVLSLWKEMLNLGNVTGRLNKSQR